MRVKVGTCGWSVRGGRKAYYSYFGVIELQDTFYRIPRLSTVKRWRADAPEDFEFVVKAWQGITHPPSSPTWRKAGQKIPPEKREKYGFFKPTSEVFEAWDTVKRICETLKSKICVFQTPPSFRCTEENVRNMRDFFSAISRGNLVLAWEPRGDWYNNLPKLKEVLEDLQLVHVVDPLKRQPLRITPIMYFRLHGLGPKDVNYRYKYSDIDLEKLKTYILKLESTKEAYVMFNNIYMFDDALRFKKLLED